MFVLAGPLLMGDTSRSSDFPSVYSLQLYIYAQVKMPLQEKKKRGPISHLKAWPANNFDECFVHYLQFDQKNQQETHVMW